VGSDNLSKAGWSLGWVSAVDSEGRTIWIVDSHRDDGKRFVGRACVERCRRLATSSQQAGVRKLSGKPTIQLRDLFHVTYDSAPSAPQ
jgi:hypothetical protein